MAHYPIIYVRGFALLQKDIEETVADPFNGFNIGSTKLRQQWTGECKHYYFESPLIRLMKDFGYLDVYNDGVELEGNQAINLKSIFIYRYYDVNSVDFGAQSRLSIPQAAEQLGNLILRVKRLICQGDLQKQNSFKVYLVAHSMGGLICRCLLQNKNIASEEARQAVDKLFTYASPHNGIDFALLGNVPSFLHFHGINNFNRNQIRKDLDIQSCELNEDEAVEGDDNPRDNSAASLDGKFDPNRVFCLVGTNYQDYTAAMGAVARLAARCSDGLVRICNATTWGPWIQNGQKCKIKSPKAFVNRSHSGYFGIVNSEEGYQNLTRFFFGDLRVDGILEVKEISLPKKIEELRQQGQQIRASYHFETVVSVRGKFWNLHRRTNHEDSSIFRTYDELIPKAGSNAAEQPINYPNLFSIFLSSQQRLDKQRTSLGFSIDIRILVPQYEIDGFLFFNDYFEGSYLFRDKLNVEIFPPTLNHNEKKWLMHYGFDSQGPFEMPNENWPVNDKNQDSVQYRIPIVSQSSPGVNASLLLNVSPWS